MPATRWDSNSCGSLNASGFDSLDRGHFDVVIVDEFHHAAARSYRTLLEHVRPIELLGLTATSERSDGLPLLDWFDHRIAAELRLWDAIDQQRLSPFAYHGIHDGVDLRQIPWRRGRGYDVEGLSNLLTSNDAWARQVSAQVAGRVDDLPAVDTLLLLRPTDSPTLFLQQLGRGLRRLAGKTFCTVLDFVGQHRKEFRFD